MGQYTFRKARQDDEPEIFRLYSRVMRPYIEQIWGWEQPWQANDFAEHFAPENITVVCAANELVGYSHVELQDGGPFIRMLLLAPEQQRQGVGEHLLQRIIEAASRRAQRIELHVFKINDAAKRFYEKHRFRVVAETSTSFVMARDT